MIKEFIKTRKAKAKLTEFRRGYDWALDLLCGPGSPDYIISQMRLAEDCVDKTDFDYGAIAAKRGDKRK